MLTADGVLVLSAPNPVEYSQARNYRNPFHLHEPSREELDAMLAVAFRGAPLVPSATLLRFGAVGRGAGASRFDAWTGDARRSRAARRPRPCTSSSSRRGRAAALPADGPALSLFSDVGGIRARRASMRVPRTSCGSTRCSRERDAALDAAGRAVRHLEELAAFRERIVVERDAELADGKVAREALAAERRCAGASATRRERDAARRAAALRERDDANAALASARRPRRR